MKSPTTKKAIAAALKISRTTLDRYLEMKGAPKEGRNGWDFGAVSNWISAKANQTATTAKSNPELAALKIRELVLRCDRLAHRLEIEKGLHAAKSEIAPALRNTFQHFRSEFGRAEQEMPARLVNRTEAEIAKELGSRFDKIFEVLHANLRQWMQTPPATS